MADQCYLFPEMADAGPNNLTTAERQSLVLKVRDWCYKLARKHAAELREAGRPFEIDDLKSEAILAATEAAVTFDPERGVKFITWAGAYVRTHLVRISDPKLSERAILSDDLDDVMGRPDSDPDADAEQREELALIQAAETWGMTEREVKATWRRLLDNLNEPAREIVRLMVFDGLTAGRIAVKLGIELKDIRLHLRNAAVRLSKAQATDDAADKMIAASGN